VCAKSAPKPSVFFTGSDLTKRGEKNALGEVGKLFENAVSRRHSRGGGALTLGGRTGRQSSRRCSPRKWKREKDVFEVTEGNKSSSFLLPALDSTTKGRQRKKERKKREEVTAPTLNRTRNKPTFRIAKGSVVFHRREKSGHRHASRSQKKKQQFP